MRRASGIFPAGVRLGVLAGAAAVVIAGAVAAVVVPSGAVVSSRGRVSPTLPVAPAPNLEVCPSGGLTWTVAQFAVQRDPVNPRDAMVVESGTVRNTSGGDVTLQTPENAVTAVPAAGSTTYPVYLTLDNSDLYPGQVADFSGTSPEVGVAAVARGPLTYQASWDNPSFAGCPLPPHRGAL